MKGKEDDIMEVINYGNFPTLEEIKRDYNELIEIIKDIKTIEQIKALDKTKQFTIEINGMFVDEFIGHNLTNENIEWIRYESYGCLSYIYNRLDGAYMFDVWSNYCDDEFIRDITIDKLTEDFYENTMNEMIDIIDEWY